MKIWQVGEKSTIFGTMAKKKVTSEELDALFLEAAEKRREEREAYRREQEENRAAPLSRDWDALAKGFGKSRPVRNPKHLWQLACKYFKEMESNPVRKKDYLRGGDRAGEIIYLEVHRPFTWQSLKAFIWSEGFEFNFDKYRNEDNDILSDFGQVVRIVESIIYAQKFEGAALGNFKEGIITAELGIKAEKADSEKGLKGAENAAPIINVYNSSPPMATSETEVNFAKDETAKDSSDV